MKVTVKFEVGKILSSVEQRPNPRPWRSGTDGRLINQNLTTAMTFRESCFKVTFRERRLTPLNAKRDRNLSLEIFAPIWNRFCAQRHVKSIRFALALIPEDIFEGISLRIARNKVRIASSSSSNLQRRNEETERRRLNCPLVVAKIWRENERALLRLRERSLFSAKLRPFSTQFY